METKNSKFLETESLSKLMIKFSVPCVLSLLVSALYNIVDQIFVGNSELSTLGNATTGIVFPIFIIAQGFAWCLKTVSTVPILPVMSSSAEQVKSVETVILCQIVVLMLRLTLSAIFSDRIHSRIDGVRSVRVALLSRTLIRKSLISSSNFISFRKSSAFFLAFK